jgi:hypothetical protein
VKKRKKKDSFKSRGHKGLLSHVKSQNLASLLGAPEEVYQELYCFIAARTQSVPGLLQFFLRAHRAVPEGLQAILFLIILHHGFYGM